MSITTRPRPARWRAGSSAGCQPARATTVPRGDVVVVVRRAARDTVPQVLERRARARNPKISPSRARPQLGSVRTADHVLHFARLDP